MGTEKRKAGVYVRISQDREGLELGVDRQEKDSKALAKRRGWEVVEVYKDNDISAYSGKKRREWERLLKDLEEHRIDAVVAYSASRMYRRVKELQRLIDLTKQNGGVEIATVVSGDVNLNTADGRMMAGILAQIDQGEAERVSERRTRSNVEKKAKGIHLGGGHRPYGYDRVPGNGFTINEAESKVVRELVKRIISGEKLNRVAGDLNARQITTVGGLRWRPGHVKRMLTKGFHAGLFPDGTKGNWPVIITDDEHEILKARLAHLNGKNSGVGRGGRTYVLSGLTTCASCGTKMTGSGGKNSAGYYSELYRCSLRDGGCGKGISAHALEQHVHDSLIENTRLFITTRNAPEPTAQDKKVIAEIRKVEARIEALASNLELEEKVLAIRTRALSEKLSSLQAQLATPRASGRTESPEELLGAAQDLYKRWYDRWDGVDEATAAHERNAIAAIFETYIKQIRVLPREAGDLEARVQIDWRAS